MKRTALLTIAALTVWALAGGGAGTGAYAQGTGPANRVIVQLNEQNNSGQSGQAILTASGDQTVVTITLSNGTAEPQPAHIHKGTCDNLDPKPAYPLTSVVNGASETTVNVKLDDLLNGQYAINVHKSAAEVTTYVACGNIVNMMMGPGGAGGGTETGGGTQTGGGTETGGTEVVGMPRTGSADIALILLALIAVAVAVVGTGLGIRLARRRA